MANDNYYLSPHENGWQLKGEGAERALKISATKSEAMEHAKVFMNKHGGSLRVQKEDGKFQEERTYAPRNDPPSSPG